MCVVLAPRRRGLRAAKRIAFLNILHIFVTLDSSFNQPLNKWNVSNVTDMRWMFADAEAFNQPLNKWDVSNVTNMKCMFKNATSFNQPLHAPWYVVYPRFEKSTSYFFLMTSKRRNA